MQCNQITVSVVLGMPSKWPFMQRLAQVIPYRCTRLSNDPKLVCNGHNYGNYAGGETGQDLGERLRDPGELLGLADPVAPVRRDERAVCAGRIMPFYA